MLNPGGRGASHDLSFNVFMDKLPVNRMRLAKLEVIRKIGKKLMAEDNNYNDTLNTFYLFDMAHRDRYVHIERHWVISNAGKTLIHNGFTGF